MPATREQLAAVSTIGMPAQSSNGNRLQLDAGGRPIFQERDIDAEIERAAATTASQVPSATFANRQ